MRIIHDIDDEMQVCGAKHGSLVELTAVNEEETVHINGNPIHIKNMLEDMLNHCIILMDSAK